MGQRCPPENYQNTECVTHTCLTLFSSLFFFFNFNCHEDFHCSHFAYMGNVLLQHLVLRLVEKLWNLLISINVNRERSHGYLLLMSALCLYRSAKRSFKLIIEKTTLKIRAFFLCKPCRSTAATKTCAFDTPIFY